MSSNFQTAFTKLSLLGQNQNALLDCSEVIVRSRPRFQPLSLMRAQAAAPPAARKQAFFPPGKTHADIEQGVRVALSTAAVGVLMPDQCASQLFPTTLSTSTAQPTKIPNV